MKHGGGWSLPRWTKGGYMSATPRRECALASAGRKTYPPPCEGPWWVVRRYFLTGRNLYACEKHAKIRLAFGDFIYFEPDKPERLGRARRKP